MEARYEAAHLLEEVLLASERRRAARLGERHGRAVPPRARWKSRRCFRELLGGRGGAAARDRGAAREAKARGERLGLASSASPAGGRSVLA